jgi:hypothetical protein
VTERLLATLDTERAALSRPPAPEPRGPCWFCKRVVPVEALIAGYDTFDEKRLACLACNELMSGNWHVARLSAEEPQP